MNWYHANIMNILVIGSGGREHALGWKLNQSSMCGQLFFAPGNGGTADLGTNLELNVDQVDTKTVDEIDYFCRQNKIGLIVIGPEDPLAEGLADRLSINSSKKTQRTSRVVFGPVKAGAMIEGDKSIAKKLMRSASIPTAVSRIFTDSQAAMAYVSNRETPVVVKAAGLAQR